MWSQKMMVVLYIIITHGECLFTDTTSWHWLTGECNSSYITTPLSLRRYSPIITQVLPYHYAGTPLSLRRYHSPIITQVFPYHYAGTTPLSLRRYVSPLPYHYAGTYHHSPIITQVRITTPLSLRRYSPIITQVLPYYYAGTPLSLRRYGWGKG